MEVSATNSDGGSDEFASDTSGDELDAPAAGVDVEKLRADLVALETELAELRSELAGADNDLTDDEERQ
ncbi:MAG: hypothetical protein DCC49_12140 [Acidobacteria bacterium]|nr:MAG: hypothetical protein DCC49_12140 [Acidobacteriota bacterium]